MLNLKRRTPLCPRMGTQPVGSATSISSTTSPSVLSQSMRRRAPSGLTERSSSARKKNNTSVASTECGLIMFECRQTCKAVPVLCVTCMSSRLPHAREKNQKAKRAGNIKRLWGKSTAQCTLLSGCVSDELTQLLRRWCHI